MTVSVITFVYLMLTALSPISVVTLTAGFIHHVYAVSVLTVIPLAFINVSFAQCTCESWPTFTTIVIQ